MQNPKKSAINSIRGQKKGFFVFMTSPLPRERSARTFWAPEHSALQPERRSRSNRDTSQWWLQALQAGQISENQKVAFKKKLENCISSFEFSQFFGVRCRLQKLAACFLAYAKHGKLTFFEQLCSSRRRLRHPDNQMWFSKRPDLASQTSNEKKRNGFGNHKFGYDLEVCKVAWKLFVEILAPNFQTVRFATGSSSSVSGLAVGTNFSAASTTACQHQCSEKRSQSDAMPFKQLGWLTRKLSVKPSFRRRIYCCAFQVMFLVFTSGMVVKRQLGSFIGGWPRRKGRVDHSLYQLMYLR